MNALITVPVPAEFRVTATDALPLTFTFALSKVRVIMLSGETWFIARDVCKAVQFTNVSDAISKLDADDRGVASTDTPGGRQDVAVVSESGLYSLILRCRGATTEGTLAHRFRRWVTDTVLREIRKTGSFAPAPVDPVALLSDPRRLLGLLGTYAQRTLELEGQNAGLTAQVEEQAPIVEAYGEIVESGGSICITDAAKAIGYPPSILRAHMREGTSKDGWLYSRPGADEVAYQPRLDRGELEHKVIFIKRSRGDFEPRTQVRVTTKGLFLLRAEMRERDRKRRIKNGEFDF